MAKFQFPFEILKLFEIDEKTGLIDTSKNYARYIQDNLDTIKRYLNNKLLKEEWTSWTPTYTAESPMTYTSVTTNVAEYCVMDNVVFFFISANGTTGGTATDHVIFTKPIASEEHCAGGGYVYDSAYMSGFWRTLTDTKIAVQRYDAGNWGLGTTKVIVVQGFYKL